MPFESLQGMLYGATALFALLTALAGIFMLNSLFKNKLQDLFTDKNFFVFFILISGYVLFALGELGWYLIFVVLGKAPVGSMPDFYWVVGQALMFLAYLALSVQLYRAYGDYQKLLLVLGAGGVLLVGIGYYLSTLPSSGFIFALYPLASVGIVLASVQIPFFLKRIPHFGTSLFLLFLTNLGFLAGDLLYISSTAQGTYGFIGVLSDFLYIAAYCLSTVAFLTFLRKAHGLETRPF